MFQWTIDRHGMLLYFAIGYLQKLIRAGNHDCTESKSIIQKYMFQNIICVYFSFFLTGCCIFYVILWQKEEPGEFFCYLVSQEKKDRMIGLLVKKNFVFVYNSKEKCIFIQ